MRRRKKRRRRRRRRIARKIEEVMDFIRPLGGRPSVFFSASPLFLLPPSPLILRRSL